MKFSIFTPTHDAKHLLEAYNSLAAQTHKDWEWVVVPNNGAKLADDMLSDTRIRILPAPPWLSGVGAFKRFACSQCEGDYLVELDHDDMLLPTALEKIAKTGAQFIYSDAAQFRANGEYQLFGKEYGWEHYSQREGDKVHQCNRSFEVNASSMHQIFYAPDHLRAWSKDIYDKVGGHDSNLGVCDDFDLVIRTYLAGATFQHIEECLYLYRIKDDGSNTWLKRNAEIQTKQQELSNKYTHALVHEWCKREDLSKYDFGSGPTPAPGFVGVDLCLGEDVWAWFRGRADNSVGCIRAYDFLEHIPHCRDSACTHNGRCTVRLMNEIYRVLVPGGWLLSATPSTDGRGAFQDPTHCSFWNSNSFWYYTRQQQRQYVPGITARFQGTRIWQEHPSAWHKEHNLLYVYADLVALKGQRQPGICEV